MGDFRVGYLYSLAPVHPGGEGDLGNVLDIVREVHTNFPYLPASSLRGCLRDEVEVIDSKAADHLFGKELNTSTGDMGVHQVWFGDARLLWVPMRTMALQATSNKQAFTWMSCHSLIRDHVLLSGQSVPFMPNCPVGTRSGTYWVADSKIEVTSIDPAINNTIRLSAWAQPLAGEVKNTWESSHIILPDNDFEVLMEHSLWTQIRNKITPESHQNGNTQPGSAEVFWTDICIPRDTIFYFPWGYRQRPKVSVDDHQILMSVIKGLFQVGGQANVGRGWVQGWVIDEQAPQFADSSIGVAARSEASTTPEQTELVGA